MKKFRKIALLVLAVTSLTLVLAGCGSNDSDGGNNDVAYNDGTYNGESEKRVFVIGRTGNRPSSADLLGRHGHEFGAR